VTVSSETVTYVTAAGASFSASATVNATRARPSATTVGFLGDPLKLVKKSAYSVTAGGAVIEGQYINGPLFINAPNVIVRNCVADATAAYWGIEIGPKATGLIIQDVTTVGGGSCGIMDDYNTTNVTLLRLKVTGGADGIKLNGNGRVVRDCYIGGLAKTASSHNDGIQASSGSNWDLDNLWVESNDTGCVSIFEGQGVWQNVTIRNSYFTGGGYPLYLGGKSMTGLQVLSNVITGWGYGPYTDLPPAANVLAFAGNTDASGKPIA
jgi:hypothetical protein